MLATYPLVPLWQSHGVGRCDVLAQRKCRRRHQHGPDHHRGSSCVRPVHDVGLQGNEGRRPHRTPHRTETPRPPRRRPKNPQPSPRRPHQWEHGDLRSRCRRSRECMRSADTTVCVLRTGRCGASRRRLPRCRRCPAARPGSTRWRPSSAPVRFRSLGPQP